MENISCKELAVGTGPNSYAPAICVDKRGLARGIDQPLSQHLS